MQSLETRPESQAIRVEIRRGLFGIRKHAVCLESGDEMSIKEGLRVTSLGGSVLIEDRGMDGKNIKTKRTLRVRGAKPLKDTYRNRKGDYFSYHLPEKTLTAGIEVEIRTPRLRVKAHRA